MGIFEQLSSLTTKVKRLCCAVDKIKESGAGSYKVYTALISQSGEGSQPDEIDTGTLTVGVTYTISNYIGSDDFTNVGAPSNTVGVSFVATGTTPANWSSASTLGLNLSAPVVLSELDNKIGNIWFTYGQDGDYTIESNGLFTGNKTYTVIQLWGDDNATFRTGVITWDSSSRLNLFLRRSDGSNTAYIGSNSNPAIWLTSIEIRVYNQ
jgi:hypothetical protein